MEISHVSAPQRRPQTLMGAETSLPMRKSDLLFGTKNMHVDAVLIDSSGF